MKKLVSVTEVQGEGLEALMGEKVTLFCLNYFYTGKLIGVNTTCVLLEDPAIIYDTGSWTNKTYEDVQSLGAINLYVSIHAIEAFGVVK